MRTIDQVIADIDASMRNLDSLCGYDKGAPVGIIPAGRFRIDSPLRCTQAAVWHLMFGKPPEHTMIQSCDRHFAMCVALARSMSGEIKIHEYGSACGLEGTFWVDEQNTCVTREGMHDLGLFKEYKSRIESEQDPNRCGCNCPACTQWIHLRGECGNVVCSRGYTHLGYTKMTMGEAAN